ncbi:Fis family transcriptional regulator [Pseudomonas oryzihabitans]|nr:Fis family transcriptional regulator [Pseudomonas psychrotolerans]KTT44139.1 Fis family transcriptional regulator [Pseudomonas psychrotolerans]
MPATPSDRHASQVLELARGAVLDGPASDPAIARSWRRCLDEHHLDPAARMAPWVLERARFDEHRERQQRVLHIARGQMNSLHQQLGGAGHAVLLTDARGLILDCVTAEAEREIFQQAGLWLGADWSEACEGTNGIGTCVVERQALTIHRDEHFRSRHTQLTCSASPVFDPAGELLAVLDVSTARQEASRQGQFHTMALVNLSAKLIESCYFLDRYADGYLLRFHAQAAYVGLLSEGLLAFDGEGRISAANETALMLLGLARAAVVGQAMTDLFELRLDDLLERARPQPSACWALRGRQGQGFHGLVRGPQVRPVSPVAVPKPSAPSGICLGDPALARDFARALKVLERDVPVLLHGETGTGKEAFASALHRASSRAGKAFVALNCAAIPETLIESELFGYRGGSFTGARKEGMAGKLQQADGGILFLDEIGDMPLALQTRLLRVLEERQVVPLGGGAPRALDLRLISASHRDLDALVAAGSFREDLYYRLRGLVVTLPALRDRSDRGALLDQLLAEEARGEPIHLDPAARACLLAQPWPGNVRQLRTVLRTLVALSEDGQIGLDELPADCRTTAPRVPADRAPVDSAREELRAVLEDCHWQMTRAAKRLGVSRNTLYRWLHQHGLQRPQD